MIRKLLFAAAAVFVGKKFIAARGQGVSATPGTPQRNPDGEHIPTDLMGSEHPGPGQRASEAFRPDPHARTTPAEREAMRPVTLPIRH